ncbi:histidinol dehydrogenase [Nannocystis sp.]|uniref:histidinol dehydrogenase n=1 Tax=Nannocystis sp. TaxID=1962667 RepID=UPI0025F9CA2D|nr:histidinol dehydrogenase [Nannocystis sp.]MBK7828047.1 histidinol dehydrogenase [Nannocystis sp.]
MHVLDLRGPGQGHERWGQLCARSAGLEGPADVAAREVIAAVRERGDAAVAELTLRFEGRQLERFELTPHERAAACEAIPGELRHALDLAAANIRRFHATQLPHDTGLHDDDSHLVSRARPLRRVAVYAPGGTAAYPSSVLMTAIPAKVAGVAEVILFTPRPDPVVLLAAELAGVDRVFTVGGAQAIAAAALGTRQIPRVDKIVGPGNAYVTAAKRQVFGLVDIDGIAGPSEVLILADHSADPTLVAADLLAQAEHDVLACPIAVTDHPALVEPLRRALAEQLETLPRRDIAARALADHGAIVLVHDRDAMVAAANDYAPEHLELLVHDPRALLDRLHSAGAIFVGPCTPEAAGDYTAGPSHVLPTAGAARFASPLGVWDFIKHTSILELSGAALRAQADAIVRIARAEGLEAHARAALLRLR